MSKETKTCFTCRKSDSSKFYNIRNKDTDGETYLEKLKSCISQDLVETSDMEMCWLCVKALRMSYKFIQTVLTSQQFLQNQKSIELSIKREGTDIKSESEVNWDVENDYCSDDSSPKKPDKGPESAAEKVTCEHCAAQFEKNWQLRKHLSRVHNETIKFVCSYCGKEFKQSYHLKEHVTSHTGEKNYSCPICGKTFQRMSSQKRHIKSHDAPPGHKTKRTPFLCTICGKSFPFSNGVQRHMRIHLGIKNFECSWCGRKFMQSTHLHVHMRTHTGEKPYICEVCGEKFSLKSCLMKHVDNRHRKINKSKVLVEEIAEPIFYLQTEFKQDLGV